MSSYSSNRLKIDDGKEYLTVSEDEDEVHIYEEFVHFIDTGFQFDILEIEKILEEGPDIGKNVLKDINNLLDNQEFEYNDYIEDQLFKLYNQLITILLDYILETSKRRVIEVTEEKKEDNADAVDIFKAEYRRMNRAYKREFGKEMIYKNQKDCAKKIVTSFKDRRKCSVMVIAPPQCGKTGVILSAINQSLYVDELNIPISNIFIITGLSSVQWKAQTRNRFPKSIHENIFHLPDIVNGKFFEKARTKKNILLFMDEVHLASRTGKQEQKVMQAFKDLKWNKPKFLFDNDIKIVEISATPGNLVQELKFWKSSCFEITKLIPGSEYINFKSLIDNNRVKKYKQLYGKNPKTKKNLKRLKQTVFSMNSPKHHIIRIRTKKIIKQNIKDEFLGEVVDYIDYDEKHKTDINEYLKDPPKRHTFWFVKNKLSCAKTIIKEHLGVIYDYVSEKTIDYTPIIQGLPGRCCGYYNLLNSNIVIFTDIKILKEYNDIIETSNWKKFKSKNVPRLNSHRHGIAPLNSYENVKEKSKPKWVLSWRSRWCCDIDKLVREHHRELKFIEVEESKKHKYHKQIQHIKSCKKIYLQKKGGDWLDSSGRKHFGRPHGDSKNKDAERLTLEHRGDKFCVSLYKKKN